MAHPLPLGFKYAGIACGIKKSGKPDLALIVADQPAAAAGVYTQNIVHAASIDWNRSLSPNSQLRGVIVNSGNANACTGEQGVVDNRELARLGAEAMNAEINQVLVLSTGIIGETLPMERIAVGAQTASEQLDADHFAFERAALAITTTDQFPKTASRQWDSPQGKVTITGMAKGAGMIGPNMATMLGVLTTDAAISPSDLDRSLRQAVNSSFNCISVDGHTSTNDAVILIASGKIPISDDDLECFTEHLRDACIELAKLIPADGEGATHVIELVVSGTESDRDATVIAKTIASSPLVKTAMTGADPNWGRIVSAAGYSGIPFNPQTTSLRINGSLIFSEGTPSPFDATAVSESIAQARDVLVELQVGSGTGQARFWTSDLTVDYVKFNSDYHT